MVLAVLASCASTGVEYGPFKYHSDKDVTLKGVEWVRTKDTESFKADSIGGRATDVDAIQAQNVQGLVKLGEKLADKVP